VLEGSTVGPLHFNMCINDIGDYLCISKCHSFADSFIICHSIRNMDDCKLL
jgi:hypothetical protein